MSFKNLPRFTRDLTTKCGTFSKISNIFKQIYSKFQEKTQLHVTSPLPRKKRLWYPEICYKLVTIETLNKTICFVSPRHILFPLHQKPSPYPHSNFLPPTQEKEIFQKVYLTPVPRPPWN